MKRLRELKVEDLRRTAIWRVSGSSDESALVEPTSLDFLTEDTSDVFVARTMFVLRNGSELLGYCSPQEDSGLDYTQPVIVVGDEHLPLFEETAPESPPRLALTGTLSLSEDDIFPVRILSEVPVNGKFYEVVIDSDGREM